MAISVLGISGGVSTPSRTTAVVSALVKAIAQRTPADTGLIEITEAAPSLFAGLSRGALGASGEAIIQRVEKADLLVVGTPVYRASYTGALKHLFDLVDYRALAGKTVLLAATGGSPYHGLGSRTSAPAIVRLVRRRHSSDRRLRRARRFRRCQDRRRSDHRAHLTGRYRSGLLA
ncbi:NAD(P)H-dependent oxidoreductase [Mesorhizobium sp. M0633]|uniref:NAD(P)H-dependent oxidoreductase n=1 Tax=Mesorhizobium sp. M0633 TaxID=2956977 RepID=UPI003338EDB2